jgi:hypothetical protein
MNKHKCNKCNKEFKYLSYLKRHNENKNKCKINNIEIINESIIKNENINTVKSINESIIKTENANNLENTNELISNNINSITEFNINNCINLFADIMKDMIKNINPIETIEKLKLLQNLIIDNNSIDNNSIDNNSIENNLIENNPVENCNELKVISNKICKICDIKFTTKQALYNHNKLGRCKGKKENQDQLVQQPQIIQNGLTFDDILNSNLDIDNSHDNNITNNNITNSNNTTNNISITINAFGCESIEHITTRQFNSLFDNFSNLNKILYNLSSLVYINCYLFRDNCYNYCNHSLCSL